VVVLDGIEIVNSPSSYQLDQWAKCLSWDTVNYNSFRFNFRWICI